MEYKIYTLQHQKLYDQIHTVNSNEKTEKILNKETLHLLNRCKELRRDFSTLSKVRGIDALFTDVLVVNKKVTYSFEHIVVIGNKVFVLERKKHYDNQRQLLKEKVAYLRKQFGKEIFIDFYILVDGKTTKPNNKKLEEFIEICNNISTKDLISHKINTFVQQKHVSLSIDEYLFRKYGVDIKQQEVKKKSTFIETIKNTSPFISKSTSNLSFLSTVILFFYIIISIFSYSIYLKEKKFLLTVGIDILFLILLVNILKEIECKLPKWLQFSTLSCVLIGLIYFFSQIIYYL